jgi:hypothetical protein
MTLEKSTFFQLLDGYARSRHQCFLAEMDLRTEEIGYSVCFRPLDVSEKLIENLSKDLNDENLRENLSAVYACKYLTIPTEYAKVAVNQRQLPSALVDQLDAELSQFAEPKKGEAPPDLWEQQTGDVPAVKPDDLKSVWRLFGDMKARNSGAAGDSVYKSVCSPGADALSVWYRASVLALIIKMRSDLLAPWICEGQPDNAVFEVAATFPMEKMRTGIVREGLPFDVDKFVAATNLRRKI